MTCRIDRDGLAQLLDFEPVYFQSLAPACWHHLCPCRTPRNKYLRSEACTHFCYDLKSTAVAAQAHECAQQ